MSTQYGNRLEIATQEEKEQMKQPKFLMPTCDLIPLQLFWSHKQTPKTMFLDIYLPSAIELYHLYLLHLLYVIHELSVSQHCDQVHMIVVTHKTTKPTMIGFFSIITTSPH